MTSRLLKVEEGGRGRVRSQCGRRFHFCVAGFEGGGRGQAKERSGLQELETSADGFCAKASKGTLAFSLVRLPPDFQPPEL